MSIDLQFVLTLYIYFAEILGMDMRFETYGITFMRDNTKAAANLRKHGILFEQATEAFFDPLLKLIDASRNGYPLESPLRRAYRVGGRSHPHHLSSEGDTEGAGLL